MPWLSRTRFPFVIIQDVVVAVDGELFEHKDSHDAALVMAGQRGVAILADQRQGDSVGLVVPFLLGAVVLVSLIWSSGFFSPNRLVAGRMFAEVVRGGRR